MSTFVDCAVYIDGVRAADGCTDDDPTAPTLLEGLSVVWGRGDTMSQPPPDSCTFDVLDLAGGEAFTSIYRTGRRVDVVAHGEAFPEPSVPTFINPGFETPMVTWAVSNGTAARTTARVKTGVYSLQVKPTAAAPVTLWLGPAEFQPAGTNPDAWDYIPTTSAGQEWASKASLWLPIGAMASVDYALFSGPYETAGEVLGQPFTVYGQDAWSTITTRRAIDVSGSGRWVGLRIVVNPVGNQWDQMAPALQWNQLDPELSWDDMGSLYVDDVQITSPQLGAGKNVLVFSGRITDISASWDEGAGAPIAQITAAGFTADLDNRNVGDEPWPVESVGARANRILTESGLPISIDIDSPIDTTLISWRDVDSQGATGLLQSLAVSVDGVLWSAVHQSIGAYLRLEDPSLRVSLLKLTELIGPPAVVEHTNLITNPDAEAFGAVATVRTNWVGNPVPASITGYGRAGNVTSTLTYEAAGGPSASSGAWIKNTITQVAAGTDNQINIAGMVTGQFRHASAWLYASKAMSLRLGAWTYDAAGAYLGSGNDLTTPNFALAANTWTYVQGLTTGAPTAYTRFQPFLRVVSATPVLAPDVYGIAAVTLSDAAGPSFNGSTPAAGDFTYSWSGAVNGSSSLQRAPAVAGPGIAAFSGGNGVRWSSLEHSKGARSFAVLKTSSASGASTGYLFTFAPLVALAGQWVTVRARVKATAGTTFGVSIRTSAGGGAGGSSPVATGDWQDVTATAQAASDGALIGCQIIISSSAAAGTQLYIDEWLLVMEGATYTGPYFDGNTPDTSTADYAWTGTAHLSTSTQSTIQTHTIIIEQANPDEGWDLSACLIVRDPVTWLQDVSDVVTRVAVQWKEQGVDDEGNPETNDLTEVVIDPALETLYGTRRVSVSTELQASADAQDVAQRILSRANPQGWRASGLAIDDEDVTPDTEGIELMLNLLDGTSRIGAPIVIGDLPPWSPAGSDAGVYLEGGTYRYMGGRWVLELTVSVATGLGTSAQWDELDPSWTWDQWSPSISWNDLRGVSAS